MKTRFKAKSRKSKKGPAYTGLNIGSILFPLFLAVAVVMLGIAATSAMQVRRSAGLEVSAAGRVVAVQLRAGDQGQTYSYPVVEIWMPDGMLKTFTVGEGSWPPAYQVGEQVQVLYNPANLDESRIASTGSSIGKWALPISTGVLGVIFLGVSFFARWIVNLPLPDDDEEDFPEEEE